MSNPEAAGAASTEATIARTIRTTLAARKISRLQLSNTTGIPYQTIRRRVDTGKNIMLEELSLIAKALQMDIRDFLPQPRKTGSGAQ